MINATSVSPFALLLPAKAECLTSVRKRTFRDPWGELIIRWCVCWSCWGISVGDRCGISCRRWTGGGVELGEAGAEGGDGVC